MRAGGTAPAAATPAPHYHLSGVAGVGMSALAQILHARGFRVSGSDRSIDSGRPPEVARKLAASGIAIAPQDGSGVTADTAALVLSTAIEPGNPDLAAADRHGVPVRHRAAVLASLADPHTCLAVTGTSGKSTVTGMIGWILECAGRDPTVVNGAVVLNWQDATTVGNVRAGASDLWVVEADESDRSLLRFHPDWAVITNVSPDHFGLEESVALFETFARQVRRGLVSALDPLPELAQLDARTDAAGSDFTFRGVPVRLNLPGRHNVENAWFALAACEQVGVPPAQAAAALARFRGIHRRLETVGTARGVTVIDDYAHNPAKIAAACAAVTPAAEQGGLILVWRPHGYGPLRLMLDELVRTFREAVREGSRDRVLLLPVYDAGGTADRSIDAGAFAARLLDAGVPVAVMPDYAAVAGQAAASAREGDTVLVMGARDPFLPVLCREVLDRLAATR